MKKMRPRVNITIGISLVSILLLTAVTVFATGNRSSFSDPAVDSRFQISTPTATPLYVPADQLLRTYTEVLNASNNAVDTIQMTAEETLKSSQSATDSVKIITEIVLAVFGAAFALLTIEGIGGLWYFARLVRRITEASVTTSELESRLERVDEDVENLRDRLAKVVPDMDYDISWANELMFFRDARENGFRLFDTDIYVQLDAATALGAMTRNPKPLARLEAVNEFHIWAEGDSNKNPKVVARVMHFVRELVTCESEERILCQAKAVLSILDSPPPE